MVKQSYNERSYYPHSNFRFAGLFIHDVSIVYLVFSNLKITYGVIVAHIMRPPDVVTSGLHYLCGLPKEADLALYALALTLWICITIPFSVCLLILQQD